MISTRRGLQLDRVVLLGRTFEEYRRYFLLEPEALRSSLAGVDPTHVFLTTWVRRATEEENIAANGALVGNVLAALERSASLRHVALVTGLKHYLGPFEDYAKAQVETPLREEMPRLSAPNFFYAQEDEVFMRPGDRTSAGASTGRTRPSATPSAPP